MNENKLRHYLSGEAMDAAPEKDESLKSLEQRLAAHREECEAHERQCPLEAKIEKKIEEKKAGQDKADDIVGVSKRRIARISGTVGRKEEGDEIVGNAIDDIVEEARETDEYDSSSFADACESIWKTLFDEAIDEFGDDDGNLDLDAWDNGKDAWIKKQKDCIDDRVGDEIQNRKTYYEEQEAHYIKYCPIAQRW